MEVLRALLTGLLDVTAVAPPPYPQGGRGARALTHSLHQYSLCFSASMAAAPYVHVSALLFFGCDGSEKRSGGG